MQRGDVVTLAGPTRRLAQAASRIGVPDCATDATDMVLVALGIVAGAMIGIPAMRLGGVEIGLSLSVGVLLSGVVCGWLRSRWPRFFGRIPGLLPRSGCSSRLALAASSPSSGSMPGRTLSSGCGRSGPSLVLAGSLDGPRPPSCRRGGRTLGLQDAAWCAAGSLRGCRNGNTSARGYPGSRQKCCADPRLWRVIRRGQRAARAVGHSRSSRCSRADATPASDA